MYMGVDQSYTSTGVVILDDDNEIIFTTTIHSNKNKDIYDRAAHVASMIRSVASDHLISEVFLEGLSFGSTGNVTRNLAGLQFLIIDYLKREDIEYTIIAPPTLKKFATGNGRAKKDEMLACAPDPVQSLLIGAYKKSKGLFDVVDAYWLAQMARQYDEPDENEQE